MEVNYVQLVSGQVTFISSVDAIKLLPVDTFWRYIFRSNS